MPIVAKMATGTRGLNVTLSSNKTPLSIKGTAKVTRLDQLADVDATSGGDASLEDGNLSVLGGATILYDENLGTFVFRKISDIDAESGEITFNAGEF